MRASILPSWPVGALLALTGLAAGWLLAAGLDASRAGPPTRTPTTATARRPTTTSTTAAAWPSAALTRAAADASVRLQEKLGKKYHVICDAPFVVAGNMPADRLRSYATHSVLRPARAMWAGYFRRRPDKVITVLLFADAESYRDGAKRLFGDKDLPHFGYFRHSDRTLVMNISTGSGTLVHELTHALIAFDWPDVPLWFNEGLASLHEQCRVGTDDITGLVNWRLPQLQKVAAAGQLRSLGAMMAANDFYGPLRGVNYAHARYFCLYLQKRGLLKTFYRKYHAAAGASADAAKLVEAVCGEPIAAVDKKLLAFLRSLKWQ